MTGKEVISSSKFHDRHSFISVLSLLLFYWLEHLWRFLELCRNFQNFGLPYMYIRSALVPQDKQASVASLVVSPLSISQKQAVCFTVSLSLSVLTSVVSSRLIQPPPPHQPIVLPSSLPLYSLVKDIHKSIPLLSFDFLGRKSILLSCQCCVFVCLVPLIGSPQESLSKT